MTAVLSFAKKCLIDKKNEIEKSFILIDWGYFFNTNSEAEYGLKVEARRSLLLNIVVLRKNSKDSMKYHNAMFICVFARFP